MDDLPEIIRTQHDGCRFAFWLTDHPEITTIQGWTVERSATRFIGFISGRCRISENVADFWANRKMLNDWIRTYRQRHAA